MYKFVTMSSRPLKNFKFARAAVMRNPYPLSSLRSQTTTSPQNNNISAPNINSARLTHNLTLKFNILSTSISFPYRHAVLGLITLSPLGGHFFKNALSSLETSMLLDSRLNLNSTKYGMLVSSFSMSNLFMPMVGGRFIDKCGHRTGLLLFVALQCLGELISTVSLQVHYSSYLTLQSNTIP